MTKKEKQALIGRLIVGLRRFVKGAIAGGLAQASLVLGNGFPIKDFADLQVLGGVLFAAFITGSLMAIQKMVSFTPEQ